MAFIGLDSISAVLLAKEDGILDVKHHFVLKKRIFRGLRFPLLYELYSAGFNVHGLRIGIHETIFWVSEDIISLSWKYGAV